MNTTIDAETMWLTVTNIALGIVTVICIAAVGYVAVKEYYVRVAEKIKVHSLLDDHSFALGDLGITMADGGERIDEQKTGKRNPDEKEEPNIIRSEN